MITLKDFIKETLNQITDATIEFARERGETGASPNPQIWGIGADLASQNLFRTEAKEMVVPVKFDVAITDEDTTSASGSAGVKVVSLLKADGTIENQTANSTTNRVQFSIPLKLPTVSERGDN